jgi:hypothetical protein
MGSISDFLELELLDHVFNAAYAELSNVYLCLCTADPTDAGTGSSMNECAASNGYARTEITFGVAASRVVDQDAIVTFPQATGGGWGTVSHWAICDGDVEGAGNMLAHGAFTASKTINEGNTPSVASGEIDVTFSANEISTYLANKLLDLVFNGTVYGKPDTFIAFTTAVIVDGDTDLSGKEVANAGAYAREQVLPAGWNVASLGLVDNNGEIAFTPATASWGTITSVAICDSGTWNAGNVLFYDNDMADQAVGDGDTAKFPDTDLEITME